MTKIKICCIQNSEEIELAARYDADAVGLVSDMPSGPGILSDTEIEDLAPRVPMRTRTVLLTSETGAGAIGRQIERFGVDAVQLVDRVSSDTHRALRAGHPDVQIIQVIHVGGTEAVDEAARVAGGVDMLLLDSGRPDAEERQLGGTGRTHDWTTSRRILEAVDVPVWLAGGLDPDNVVEAVRAVRPHGVDVCSGLRPGGRLDEELLRAFARGVRRADRELGRSV